MRVLFTATLLILGLGYLFALLNIYFSYARASRGQFDDAHVRGHRGGLFGKRARLDPGGRPARADGHHAASRRKNSPAELGPSGRRAPDLRLHIKPIIDKRCVICHDGSNPHLPSLSDYDGLKKVSALDTGASIASLVRLSHIHLFGMTFIFFVVGLIFSHAYIRPVWFKCAVIGLPFVGIGVDVSSWYFIKLFHPFAWAGDFRRRHDGRMLRRHVAGRRCTRCGSPSRRRPSCGEWRATTPDKLTENAYPGDRQRNVRRVRPQMNFFAAAFEIGIGLYFIGPWTAP